MSIQEMTLDELRKALPSYTIQQIAQIIWSDWEKVSVPAKPYLEAMMRLHHISECFIHDSGDEIVGRFLNNATGWRGPIARVVKYELNRRRK